ncbi:hypothetical protein BGZ68_001553, partial [Mortierella alpina]
MSAENLQEGQQTTPPSVPSSFAAAHEPITANDTTAAGTATPRASSSSRTSSAGVKAAMQARRLSRGLGEGLRPDFVFPKPHQSSPQTHTPPPSAPSSAAAANGSSSGLHSQLNDLTLSEQETPSLVTISATDNGQDATERDQRLSVSVPSGSLALPKNQQQQHLKTHYRTHSRNGSTVTVQDLKQAIAAVSTDLLDMPPLAVDANGATVSAGTSDAAATATAGALESGSGSGSAVDRETVGSANSPPRSKLSTVSLSDALTPETPTDTLPPLSSFSTGALAATQESGVRPDSPPAGLGLQMDAIRRYSSLDSLSAPSTPLRDSYAGSLQSPSAPSRPSSMILGRATRDRPNASVPP